MDARLVTAEIADVLAKLHWIRFIRFSCDTVGQIASVKNAARLLQERGIKASRIFVYLLVTADIADAERRVRELCDIGKITIYAQAEQNPSKGIKPNAMQREFANRYIYSGCYRNETWDAYCKRKRISKGDKS